MVKRNRTGCIQRLDSLKTTQSQMADVGSIMHCRVCFRVTRDNGECLGTNYSCSGWSNEQSPHWTEEFRDSGRSSAGCFYQWSLECGSGGLTERQTPPQRPSDGM